MSLQTRVAPVATSTGASLALLASIVVSFLASSSAPTPLYALYQSEWGFSPITTTVVFGVYALAVLLALLVLGRLSDHVGRRPVLLVALAAQGVAMVVFATAAGVPELLAARVVQGLATGAALGALGAALLDLDRERGSLLNAVVPGAGTALGALVSGLVVQFLPGPTHLIYVAGIVVFAIQFAGVLMIPETVTRRPGARASLRPDVSVPRHVRRAVLTAVPVLFAVWSLAGFYASLGPAIARAVTGSSSFVLGGLALFVLAGVAAASVYVLRHLGPDRVMGLGVAALVVGVGVTLVGVHAGSTAVFFVGTAIAGLGFGSGFQGGMRTVMPLPHAHERAGVLSVLYVVCYLGMGLPAVIAGVLVVHGGGLMDTAYQYGLAVMLLAALALPGMLRRPLVSDLSAEVRP
jgi:predicted MFS family arabinose efflux permease